MGHPSIYWTLYVFTLTEGRSSYTRKAISEAHVFFANQFPNLVDQAYMSEEYIQKELFSTAYTKEGINLAKLRPEALLCLRCYISHFVVLACKGIGLRYGARGGFYYWELLHLVLDDRGQILQWDEAGQPEQSYLPFSYQVLKAFRPDREGKVSLAGLTTRKVQQHKAVADFLLEHGQLAETSWAILNRTKPAHFSSQLDQKILEAYHSIYRDDYRRNRGTKKGKKCTAPTIIQLQAIADFLQEWGINKYDSTHGLNNLEQKLIQLSEVRRQNLIASQRKSPITRSLDQPLTPSSIETTPKNLLSELEDNSINLYEQIEQAQVDEQVSRLQKQFQLELPKIVTNCLDMSIEQWICDRFNTLNAKKKTAHLAAKFIPALYFYYNERRSGKQIVELLQFSSPARVSNLLEPERMLGTVRSLTTLKVLDAFQKLATDWQIEKLFTDPTYFPNLQEEVIQFLDKTLFETALKEINFCKKDEMNSLYIRRVQVIISKFECQNRA